MIINIRTTFEPINKTIVKNVACPNCSTKDNVEIIVYQKHVDTGLIYKVTNKLTGTAHCLHCNTNIANVQWTPEIENTFEKLKQESSILEPYTKWSLIFKLLVGFLVIGFISLITYFYFLFQAGKQTKEIYENPAVNNKFLIHQMITEGYGKIKDYGNSWATVRKINGDTLFIQFHKNNVLLEDINGSSAPENGYDGNLYKIKKGNIKTMQRITEYHQQKNMGLNNAYIWATEKE